METRCATLPYIRHVAFDREWRGVTASMAGNGPRQIYLKAVTDYAINPHDRVWSAIGVGSHENLAASKNTDNTLPEERTDAGTLDLLSEDEFAPGYYILSDYKVWGSYKVCSALGYYTEDEPQFDENDEPIVFKSGKRKGQQKTKKVLRQNPDKVDLLKEILQLNRYRIEMEEKGFPISHIQIQAMPRDGGTIAATSRGIKEKLYIIELPIKLDSTIIAYYDQLTKEVNDAFITKYARKCDDWESWNGRRCNGYCEVAQACKEMGE